MRDENSRPNESAPANGSGASRLQLGALSGITHMLTALRIGAGVCLMVAGLILYMTLLEDMSFTRGGGVIIRKYVSTSGSLTQFQLDCKLQRGGEYDSVYSRRFYEAAREGDHLQFPLHGYTRLVRDGHTVGRDFSEDLIFPLIYSFFALLPSILFIPAGRLPCHRWLCGIAGVIEVSVVGLTLYSLFAPCC